MKFVFSHSFLAAVALAWSFALPCALQAQSRTENFNGGWRFGHGAQSGAEAVAFDDSAWTPVHLPHDWAIAGPTSPRATRTRGSCPGGAMAGTASVSHCPPRDAGERVYLDFDGVMAMPTVYVNGQKAGEWDYGYMSFRVDATRSCESGEKNVVAVHVDTREHHRAGILGQASTAR